MAIINNNNVQNVKFLRNGTAYNSHDLAYNALTGFTLTDEQDGTAILARYTAEDTNVKTLVGWVYKNGGTSYVTIQDVEGASADIMALLGGGVSTANTVTMQLNALSGNNESTSAETSVAGAKAYTDDKIDELKDSLEYTGVTTGDGVVIVNVTEADGIISGKTAEVGGLKLTDYTKGSDSGAVATTDSINGAFSKVENQIDAVNDKINNLDYTDTAVTKQFVAAVDETDGVISVTRGEIESSGKTIVLTADGNDVNFEVNIDNDTIVQDETSKKLKVASAALTQYVGDGKTIEISAADANNNKTVSTLLTLSSVTPSSTTVKEEYALKNASGETIGSTIKIYKDSSLVSIELVNEDPTQDPPKAGQFLKYTYIDASGATQSVYVDVSALLVEAEFESGVTANAAGVVHGVVDPDSEKDSNNDSFLTVGANGFKIDGIKDEIDKKLGDIVGDLDATVTAATSGNHVTITIDEVDGKLTQSGLTIQENDIASATDLAALSAKTVTALTSTNGSITAQIDDAAGCKTYDIETDASKIKMTGFTADASGFTAITSASTVTEAVKAIETTFLDNEETTAAALNDLNTRINTVSGDVETIEEKYISGVSVNGSATTVTDHVAGFNIISTSAATTATSGEAITVVTDANGNITLGLATIDCGTY